MISLEAVNNESNTSKEVEKVLKFKSDCLRQSIKRFYDRRYCE